MLDDMHNFFPDLLYDNGRFRSVSDVFAYINTQMNDNFNLYSSARSRNVRPRMPAPAVGQHQHHSYFDDIAHIDIGQQRVTQPVVAVPHRQPAPVVPIRRTTNTVPSLLFPGLEVVSSEYIMQPPSGGGGATAAFASIASLLTGSGDIGPRNLMDIFAGVPGFSESVAVRPTALQISAATTEEVVSGDLDEDNVCAICQDDIAVGTTMRIINYCDHSFHKQCIDTWFAQNVHCPVCRHDIRIVDNEEGENEGETVD